MRREIAIVAGPKDWGDTRESWLARVPRKVKTVSFRTVKALWYGEIQSDDHWAARDIRREAERIERQSVIDDTRKEALALAAQYERIIGGMRVQDQDFFGPQIDRLERLVDQIRSLDRT